MKTATIRAIAHALPTATLTNEELEKRFSEKEVRSIARMSGIRTRRVVRPGQTASDLALAAAQRLLSEHQIDPASIDLLTFASQTPDYRIPATAPILCARLGLPERCCAFDIGQACSSFLHSLQVAQAMLVAGTARRALVLNGDALSTLIHPRDRGLVALHGDGGTAALLEPLESSEGGIEFIDIGTDGSKYDRLIVPAGGARQPSNEQTRQETTDSSGCTRSQEQLWMDGPAIFHFSTYKVTDVLKQLLDGKRLSIADLDLVLLHQANRTMIDLIYKSLAVPEEKRFYYHEEIGNLSGPSLPATLAQAWREGRVKPGSRTLLCAFGGGLSWGTVLIRWPGDAAAAVAGPIDVPAAS